MKGVELWGKLIRLRWKCKTHNVIWHRVHPAPQSFFRCKITHEVSKIVMSIPILFSVTASFFTDRGKKIDTRHWNEGHTILVENSYFVDEEMKHGKICQARKTSFLDIADNKEKEHFPDLKSEGCGGPRTHVF